MLMTTEIPIDVFADDPSPGIGSTAVGEFLAQLADVPAGAWLAVMLEGVDPTSLTPVDLLAYLSASARVQAWAAAKVTDGVAEMASRGDIDGVDVEVALALSEPIGAAPRRIWYSKRPRRLLPKTMTLFRAGKLSQRHAEGMVDAFGCVDDPALAGEVESRALRLLAGKTASELRKHARRILTRLDPAGAEDRARAAREQADVTFEPDEDGMSDVYAHLPVEDGRLVKEAVDAAAITAKQTGDSRPIGVLRANALSGWAADYLTGTAGSAGTPRAAGRPIEIGIVVGLATALGRDELPAEVPGCGIIPREAIAAMVATELPKLRLLVVDESTGRLVHRAVDSYRPTADQVAQVRAAWVTSAGPGSQVFATRCDTDHAIAHPEGPTSIDNLLPPDRTWHVRKTHTPLSVTINPDRSATWNTALGQSRTVAPYDYLFNDHGPEQPGASY